MAEKVTSKASVDSVDKASQVAKKGVEAAQHLPTDRLKSEAQKLAGAYAQHAIGRVGEKVNGLTERLTDYADGGGGPGLKAAINGGKAAVEGKSPAAGALKGGLRGVTDKVKNAFGGGGKKGGGNAAKATNIVEYIDIGVPIEVAYNQWTQFQDFPSFMRKVERAEQEEDTKITWKAQVFWSHRTWESTIVDQEPEDHIVWKSSGAKGYVDGAVTFHELAPNLTRVLVVLEYHPQGFFERTGNIWRAQGRRARLELKHFRRHVMTQTLLHPEEVEGWRGEIKEGEVTRSHEDAVAESAEKPDEAESEEKPGEAESEEEESRPSDEDSDEDEYSDEYEDEYDDDEEEPDDESDEETDEYDEDDELEDEPVSTGRGHRA